MSTPNTWDPFSIGRLQHLCTMAGILLSNDLSIDKQGFTNGRVPSFKKRISLPETRRVLFENKKPSYLWDMHEWEDTILWSVGSDHICSETQQLLVKVKKQPQNLEDLQNLFKGDFELINPKTGEVFKYRDGHFENEIKMGNR